MINTTHGLLDPATLKRTIGFDEDPQSYTVWVEWRLNGELVRRDAWCIVKEVGVAAEAIAAAIS